jgi:hypothetical protein
MVRIVSLAMTLFLTCPATGHVKKRCADYLHATVKGSEERFSEYPLNPSAIMGVVELYRVTIDPQSKTI